VIKRTKYDRSGDSFFGWPPSLPTAAIRYYVKHLERSDHMHVYWLSDSGGKITCHRNGPGMDYEESRLATLRTSLGSDDVFYVLKQPDGTDGEPVGPFPTVQRAKDAVQTAVGGRLLSRWD
jgi:hypothetical protein